MKTFDVFMSLGQPRKRITPVAVVKLLHIDKAEVDVCSYCCRV